MYKIKPVLFLFAFCLLEARTTIFKRNEKMNSYIKIAALSFRGEEPLVSLNTIVIVYS